MGLFDSESTSFNTSQTLTNTGSGLAVSGSSGGTIVYNDPKAALQALEANSFVTDRSLTTVDKAVQGNTDIATNALSGALKAVGDTVLSANGVLEKTQQLYYEKIADNAGVAPQTLQQQQQSASADTTKTVILGAVFVVGLFFLTPLLKSSK